MAVKKFSQITTSSTPIGPSDYLLGVQGGTDDVLFTQTQVTPGIYVFKGTVSTDIGTSLNSFMADVSDNHGGGIVILPPGTFLTSVQVAVPIYVKLRGAGKRTTILQATGGFPTATAVIRLGRVADTTPFDTALEDIQIDCNAVTNSIGVYGFDLNEGCGCFRTIVKNFRDIGIWYDTDCENFQNVDLEILNTNTSSNYCVKVAGSGTGGAGTGGEITFDRCTTIGTFANTLANYYLSQCHFIGINLHCEGAADGILVNGDYVFGGVYGINGVTDITTLVHFNGASDFAIYGAWLGLATNIVVDDTTSTNVTSISLNHWTRKLMALGSLVGSSVFNIKYDSTVNNAIGLQNTTSGGGTWYLGDGSGFNAGYFTVYNATTTEFFAFGGQLMTLRAGTSPTGLQFYNTYSGGGSNYERAVFDWQPTANVLTIGAQAAGTGTLRNVVFVGTELRTTATSAVFLQWGGINDYWKFASSSGTLSGESNAAGIRFIFAIPDASLRVPSDGFLRWQSSTTLASGSGDTSISRSAAAVIALGNGTQGDGSATILAKTKAGAFVAGDIPSGTWALCRDTSGATTKMIYNNAGTLMTVALV